MSAFKQLPMWAKGVVAVGVLLGVGVGTYYLVKFGKRTSENMRNNRDNKVVKDDLKKLNKDDSTKQKISDSQAKSLASGLFTAMDNYGTDEDAIYSIFRKVKNDADVLAVIKAYGTKTLTVTGLWTSDDYTGDLAGSLRQELSPGDMNRINTILDKKGIEFRF